jgi:hypothetical protein
VCKTKLLEKHDGVKGELFRQFLEAVYRVSGSPFSVWGYVSSCDGTSARGKSRYTQRVWDERGWRGMLHTS